MLQLIRRLMIALAVLAAPALPASATKFPAIGGSGDNTFNGDLCDAGQYMVGLKGRVGGWVDQVRLICAPVLSGGLTGEKVPYKFPRGGTGGTPIEVYCPPDYFVMGWQIGMTAENRQVKHIYMTCYAPKNGQTNQVFLDAATVTGATNRSDTGPISNFCPRGELATGFHGRDGRHVAALGLICDTFVIPALRVEPKTPVLAPYVGVSFFNNWNTVTGGNGQFEMILSPDRKSGPNNVSGVFNNLQGAPQYNGTLRGTIAGNELNYTFEQATGTKGTGVFHLSDDGGSISGEGRESAGNQTPFSWKGTLKRSFTGLWDTVTGANGHFEMVTTQSGYAVLGEFTNTDGAPQYNGSFLGDASADGNSFTYRYNQSRNGTRGDGRFNLSADGKSMTGTLTVDGDPSVYTWKATRKTK